MSQEYQAATMTAKMSLTRTFLLSVAVGAILWVILGLVVDPAAGEGSGLDPHSVRYAFGVFLHRYETLLFVIAAWPFLVVAYLFRLHDLSEHTSFVGYLLGCLAAGFAYVNIWNWIRKLHSQNNGER